MKNFPKTKRLSSADLASSRRVAALALVMASFASATAQAGYIITNLGTLGGNSKGSQSHATGINSTGQVVGYSTTADGTEHAFLYHSGTMIDLGAPSGGNSYAYGINDAGQIVGYSTTADGTEHAFLYSSGTMIDLGALSGGNSYAYGINDAGQVVGYSTTADGAEHAFLYDGTMIDLGVSLSGNSNAYGINNGGQIVGYFTTADDTRHAFLYSSDSGMTDLGTLPGGVHSVAYGINDSGQVVGYSTTAGGSAHAFRYGIDGKMADLGALGGVASIALGINDVGDVVGNYYPEIKSTNRAFRSEGSSISDLNNLKDLPRGWTLMSANDINDNGQIVGYGRIAGGGERAFLLTPVADPDSVAVPEPSTFVIFGVAFVGCIFIPWRRRLSSTQAG